MKSLLNDLYYGKISPWERHFSSNQDTIELEREIDAMKQNFTQNMSVDDVQCLESLTSLHLQSSSFAELDAFTCGFKLGAGLMLETLTET